MCSLLSKVLQLILQFNTTRSFPKNEDIHIFPTAAINFPIYGTTALSHGHSALHSPAVAGDGPCFQIPVCERINSGAQPLILSLVHGVKNMNNLVTFHWQGTAVQLAGDVQIQADMKRVPGCDKPFFQFWQQLSVTCSNEERSKARSATGQNLSTAAFRGILWEKHTAQTSEALLRESLYF